MNATRVRFQSGHREGSLQHAHITQMKVITVDCQSLGFPGDLAANKPTSALLRPATERWPCRKSIIIDFWVGNEALIYSKSNNPLNRVTSKKRIAFHSVTEVAEFFRRKEFLEKVFLFYRRVV
jgi:hypothetical protein